MEHTSSRQVAAGAGVNVSVVIPAHNAAGTIAETLASLHAQTYKGWKAIVVDDGSSGHTAAIAVDRQAPSPRVGWRWFMPRLWKARKAAPDAPLPRSTLPARRASK
jgi:glycosyltransferase involved in cell wall biosynthesis